MKTPLQDINFIEAVAERDIDLLLLEEFHSDDAFSQWFAKKVFENGVNYEAFIGAWHSIIDKRLGESDLILAFEDAKGLVNACLIENKISADRMERQAERYIERGEVGETKGLWASYRSCLIAPKAYFKRLERDEKFDSLIAYEDVIEWFSNDKASPRDRYKCALLTEAIEQNRRGYQVEEHPQVTAFWQAYWRLVQDEFSVFLMPYPQVKPSESDWPTLKADGLPERANFKHKMVQGYMDLEFPSTKPDLVEQRYGKALAPDMEIVQTGKSSVLRICVPSVDRFSDFESEKDKIRRILGAAKRLLEVALKS